MSMGVEKLTELLKESRADIQITQDAPDVLFGVETYAAYNVNRRFARMVPIFKEKVQVHVSLSGCGSSVDEALLDAFRVFFDNGGDKA